MKKLTIILAVIFIIVSSESITAQYQNFMLFPSGRNQIEPSIVRHPLNPQILLASAYTIISNQLREGIYLSTNGGLNWFGADTVLGLANQNVDAGDPGPVIDKNGRFILTHQGSFPTGMYSDYSTNQGLLWTKTAVPIATGDNDKGAPGTDDAPASPFYGRSYLAWTRFTNPFPIVFAYTTDGAVTWSSVIQINTSFNSNRSNGPYVSVGPQGNVYVAWASSIPVSPLTEDAIGFAKSTNGGLNWQVSENAFDCNGIRTTQLTPWNIRANSFPVMDVDKTGGSRNGWIYIATTDKNLAPAGSDPDIVMHRSTDGGTTWSPGVRVNQDPLNNGRNQFFPAIRVDEQGGINILYYDNRSVLDSADTYISRSTDGGVIWTDYRISSNRFRPAPVTGVGQGNMGDNIGMTSGNNKLYPVWMSNQSGILQVWSAIIDYTTIGVQQIGTEVPKEFRLEQNYPNPFNPETNINFSITKTGNASMKIYNSAGILISTLAEQELKPGEYSVKWNASDEPSGVYFYTLETSDFRESKKMILVK
ncbi:MAG: T9SS type A sorting domain-containing protein [Ignavibacteria bacterium]